MQHKVDPENIIDSLEGIQRAEPKPFFSARVLARLRKRQEETTASVLLRLGWAVSLLAILFIANMILFFNPSRSGEGVVGKWKSATPNWVVDYTEQPGTSVYDRPRK